MRSQAGIERAVVMKRYHRNPRYPSFRVFLSRNDGVG